MGLEDQFEIKNLRIESELEPKDVLRTPEREVKPLYKQLQDEKTTKYDTWCQHSD